VQKSLDLFLFIRQSSKNRMFLSYFGNNIVEICVGKYVFVCSYCFSSMKKPSDCCSNGCNGILYESSLACYQI